MGVRLRFLARSILLFAVTSAVAPALWGHHPAARALLSEVTQYKTGKASLVAQGKRRYDAKQKGFGGQTKPIFRKKVRAELQQGARKDAGSESIGLLGTECGTLRDLRRDPE